jgi:hypothetical protein
MDRDVVGIANALAEKKHDVILWKPSEDDISQAEFDIAIFCDHANLGYKVKSAVKKKPVLFLKTKPLDGAVGVTLDSIPACADLSRFPPSYYDKKLANDVFLFLQSELDERKLNILSKIPKNLTFKIIGVKCDLPNYIGNTSNVNTVSKLATSSKVCLDFELTSAYDLAKIGCNVITDSENQINLPIFNEENFLDKLTEALNKKRAVINEMSSLIMPYSQFLDYISEILEVEL